MGGGSCDIASVWGVESRISVSMQARKVGESPEGSQAGKEGTPSVWERLVYDAMAKGQVPTRWIIIGIFNLSEPYNSGIIWSWTPESITRESRHNLTTLEIACVFVSWRFIFMIFWTQVQKHTHCQCQKDFSPGGTISGIFTTLNDLANIWINWKANFDVNENLWVWGIITFEKRQEVPIHSN